MEQEYLSQKEIYEYIINRLDTDTEIDNANNVTPLSSLAYSIGFDPTGQTKEEQLDELYFAFKNYFFIETSMKKHLSQLKIDKFLPYKTLEKDVWAFGNSKTYSELNTSESQKIWVLMRLRKAVRFAIGIAQPRTKPHKDTQNIVSSVLKNMPYFDYKSEIEDFFKYTISTRADAMTLNLIDNLKSKVERLIKIEVAKTKTNGNTNQLLGNAQTERLNILSEISFGLEWHDLGQPTTKQTNILCRWEEQEDYESFVEKILLIESLEKTYFDCIYPDYEQRQREAVYNRKKREKEKREKRENITREAIKEYLLNNLADRITKPDIRNLTYSLDELFKTKEIPKNVMAINSVNDLTAKDIRALFYNIWEKYDCDLGVKLDQLILAEFIKKQFPTTFKKSGIDSIKSHIKEDGYIIKIKHIENK